MAAAQAGSDEAARGQTTRLLRAVGAGEASAKEQLLPLVYDELHRLAGRLMAGERRSHTLQPTALMNEAFLRLVEPAAGYDDRGHFLRVAATAMRRVLVDHARARGADKRRGDRRVELDADLLAGRDDAHGLLVVDEILARLSALDPHLGQLVELRFFGGLDNRATAEALGTSLRSVERSWRTARAFLVRELDAEDVRG
ncbi:MAG: sigma-70 family RNA polymerase sigma factor [Planctomycetes bacterium]|nr:sigma-70 family RNA polymerase sigma factor [Planctomycetota bacterium]